MRVQSQKRPPEERIHDFKEVSLGFSPEQAVEEAGRCLQCKVPFCVEGCPLSIDIPGFIACIKERRFSEAHETIAKKSVYSDICGRVCPQEVLCEHACILYKAKKPVAIGELERFAASQGTIRPEQPALATGRHVAIIGSGPSGLCCARELALLGHQVTIYEALPHPGGLLHFGIPRFRLPRRIIRRHIDLLSHLGVRIVTGTTVGDTITLRELQKQNHALFFAVGCWKSRPLKLPGDSLPGVYYALEYLKEIHITHLHDEKHPLPEPSPARHIVIIGGGNTAIDVARVIRRYEKKVTVVYRKPESFMVCGKHELAHAKEEGIQFLFDANIRSIEGTEHVEGIVCSRTETTTDQKTGQAVWREILGETIRLACDQVIIAIGQMSSVHLLQDTCNLALSDAGFVRVNDTMETNLPGIFAGGDLVSGPATVVHALAAGKRAAAAINTYLMKQNPEVKL